MLILHNPNIKLTRSFSFKFVLEKFLTKIKYIYDIASDKIVFTIENNTNYDITILFDNLSINNLGSVDSMINGSIKKGTKEKKMK